MNESNIALVVINSKYIICERRNSFVSTNLMSNILDSLTQYVYKNDINILNMLKYLTLGEKILIKQLVKRIDIFMSIKNILSDKRHTRYEIMNIFKKYISGDKVPMLMIAYYIYDKPYNLEINHKKDIYSTYILPGGKKRRKETTLSCLYREIREEVGIYIKQYKHTIKLLGAYVFYDDIINKFFKNNIYLIEILDDIDISKLFKKNMEVKKVILVSADKEYILNKLSMGKPILSIVNKEEEYDDIHNGYNSIYTQ